MKSWKKTKRYRKHRRYRRFVPIKLNLDRETIKWLREESRKTNVSIIKIISKVLREYIHNLRGENKCL